MVSSDKEKRSVRLDAWQQTAGSSWHDWQWQWKHRLTSASGLEQYTPLSDAERAALTTEPLRPPFAVTPYYLTVINDSPLRKSIIPQHISVPSPHETHDPLGEEKHKVTNHLIHTYPDKALLLVTDQCPAYCRYCTRKRRCGRNNEISGKDLTESIAYIRQHPEIRDVLVSGGDPLSLMDRKVDTILSGLRSVPTVEIIRIGTKMPMTLPQRITPALCRMLQRHHPLWISIHCTHPDEWTAASQKAVKLLVDFGLPCISQTVLLKGINDNVETIRTLMLALIRNRIKPYYLFLPDMVEGITPFLVDVDAALDIIRSLHGYTSGLAVPTLMIDAPGGGGKIPLLPDYVKKRTNGRLVLSNYQNKLYSYP